MRVSQLNKIIKFCIEGCIVLSLSMAAISVFAAKNDNNKNLEILITEVSVVYDDQVDSTPCTPGDDTIHIRGTDFDDGEVPIVTLGDKGELGLCKHFTNEIVVQCPPDQSQGGVGICPDGDYMLTVTTDSAVKNFEEYNLTIGAVGPDGIQGVQGKLGDPGPQGAQGKLGPQGEQGKVGPPGSQGVQGKIGALGPQGVQGKIGAQGEQGKLGSQGDPGLDGADGKTVLSGDVPPVDATDGVDGDFYIDTLADAIYGPKTDGAWGAATSLVGPQGLAGTDGSDGAQGVQGKLGPQGEQGKVGPPGSQGDQGKIGPPGPQGVQGKIGPQGSSGLTGYTKTEKLSSGALIPVQGDVQLKVSCSTSNQTILGGGCWSSVNFSLISTRPEYMQCDSTAGQCWGWSCTWLNDLASSDYDNTAAYALCAVLE